MRRVDVLVTGASGFIGSALASRLIRDGVAVRVLVRDRARLKGRWAEEVEVVAGDITDVEAVRRAVEGVGTVFHLAGAFREPGLSSGRYEEVNVGGTVNVARAAAQAGARRFVHCSTSGIHGSIRGAPAAEDHPLVLEEVYERTKAEGEKAALCYGATHGLEVTALRPAQVYGPGDLRLLKLFKVLNGRVAVWFGPGTARYHLLYIDDLIDAFLLAANSEQATGKSFLIGGPETPSLNAMIEELSAVLGKRPRLLRLPSGPFLMLGSVCEAVFVPLGLKPPIYRRRMEFFTKDKAYDIGRARKLLGFAPKIGMREGLKKTADWYRAEGYLS
jgi:dihydroflavonol-4-reductase